MSADDIFYTVDNVYEAEIKVKASRFIGTIAPAVSVEEAESFVHHIAKTYYDATHHCYAFRIRTVTQPYERFSDAGEPAGTAGPPIMDVLRGRELINVAVVVTRYFGGTKLGKGGLVRAYRDCTIEAIGSARIVQQVDYQPVSLRFDYEWTGQVMRTIEQFQGHVISSQYDSGTELRVNLPRSRIKQFTDQIIELTSGQITIHS
ncbi:YigZ family protein [candidate division KSB1 bacterium]|nr:YigZ family protein [candidate division KSB1 bacterium]